MKFMTQEWFDAVSKELDQNDNFKIAISNVNLGIQQVATEVPSGGEIHHFLKADNGQFELGVGDLEAPDATMSASYADAVLIHKGELDAMSAFSSGRMLVQGNLAVLMQHQAVLAQMSAAMEAVRDDTEYEV
jgi:putative sterol carrier protein